MNKVIALTLLAGIGGASIPVVAKIGLEVFGPFTLIMFRFGLSAALLWMLVPAAQRGLKTARQLLVISILGALNPILLFVALQFTEANLVALIYAILPVMTAAYLFLFHGERLQKLQTVGLLIGLAGVLWIALRPLFGDTPDYSGAWANLVIVLAAVAVMFFAIKSRAIQASHDIAPTAIIYHFAIVALVVSLPLAGFEMLGSGSFDYDSIELRHVLAALAVGISSVAGYLPQQYVLKVASATVAFMTSYIQPVLAAILAGWLLDEQITVGLIVGGGFILFGAWLVQRYRVQETSA